MVRLMTGWRRVLSAWALVLIVAGAGFAVVELAPSLGLAKSSAHLHGVRIPQAVRTPYADPFDLGPPAYATAGQEPEHDSSAVLDPLE
jgi:hypothetical protein